MEPREIKGLEIAAKTKLTRQGKSNLWLVPSQTNKQEKYTVALDDEKPSCTCRDHEFTSNRCKHIFAVEYTIEREQTADGATITTETVKVTRKTYTQNWPAYNAAQTQEKSQLQALLSMNCAETFLSLSNCAEGRAYRWPTSSLPARSRFTPRFQAVAFRVICRKQNGVAFCQRCHRTIRCFVTWKRKLSRLTCTS